MSSYKTVHHQPKVIFTGDKAPSRRTRLNGQASALSIASIFLDRSIKMDNVGIIIIALLLCAVILGPLYVRKCASITVRWLTMNLSRACATVTRGSRPRIYNPQEGDINDACQRLKSVTTRSSVSHGQTTEIDLEAATPQAEFGEW